MESGYTARMPRGEMTSGVCDRIDDVTQPCPYCIVAAEAHWPESSSRGIMNRSLEGEETGVTGRGGYLKLVERLEWGHKTSREILDQPIATHQASSRMVYQCQKKEQVQVRSSLSTSVPWATFLSITRSSAVAQEQR